MKYLILVNTKYPFGSGETYLESEMVEISNLFDKILVFPIDTLIHEKMSRKLPADNISAFPFEKLPFNVTKAFSAIKALFTMQSQKGNTVRKKFIDSYFQHHSIDQANRIIKHLNQINFQKTDEVILYSYWFYTGARICVELKQYFYNKVKEVKAISRAHRFDVYEYANDRNYLPQRELLLSEIDKVYVCSEDGERYIKNGFPDFMEKITTSKLGTYDHGVKLIDKKLKFEIVSCSRVTIIKQLSKIIDALYLLEKKGYDYRWTHLGDGPLLEDVKKQAQALLPEDKYVFLGQKNNNEVYEYYSNQPVNLFLNVSTSEGLPVSIMEAISFGIPVIATDVGGTSEIITDQVNGYLLKENFEIEVLSKQIERFINMDEVEYKKMCKNARRSWENNFDAKKNYVDFIHSIDSI